MPGCSGRWRWFSVRIFVDVADVFFLHFASVKDWKSEKISQWNTFQIPMQPRDQPQNSLNSGFHKVAWLIWHRAWELAKAPDYYCMILIATQMCKCAVANDTLQEIKTASYCHIVNYINTCRKYIVQSIYNELENNIIGIGFVETFRWNIWGWITLLLMNPPWRQWKCW